MTMPVGGPNNVLGRINQIENALNGGAHTMKNHGSTVAFEPFGAAYQRALAGPKIAPPVQGASGVSLGAPAQFATRLPGRTTFGMGANRPAGPGNYGKLSPPPHLAAYGNGRIPKEALVPIGQGGHRLEAQAAVAWQGVVAAAKADGIDLTITDSYRSYDQQVDLVRRKGLYSEGGLGAKPGTSNHGWGLAVDADVTDQRTLDWLRTNGPRFGWLETVPREPWHWEFRPHQA